MLRKTCANVSIISFIKFVRYYDSTGHVTNRQTLLSNLPQEAIPD